MAYNVIFTVSGAGSDTGPFNISGTTNLGVTTLIQSNVPKATLEAGYEVTIPDNTITGGTIASVGTCTTSQSWTKPTISLVVYAKDVGVTGTPAQLQYMINQDILLTIGTLTSTCSQVYTITGLTAGDLVTFSTSTTCRMNGAENTSTCPADVNNGGLTEYTTTINSYTPDSVAITINRSITV